jgi:uridylate kinase
MSCIQDRASTSDISVLKFGGSSFSTPDAYRRVARYLANRVADGEKLCVVVSAMSGTTGRLLELLDAICPQASFEDRDAVLGTGEILAAALVRAALAAERVEAISLNAFQLGWRAAGSFASGKLESIPGTRLKSALDKAQVVVMSGGQATDENDRLMMLGRNSSDLTAVAAAVALNCDSATIFSDIEGVCTADPYRFVNTRLIPELTYSAAKAYSRAGAKVLFSGCVELAEKYGVEIRCASLKEDGRVYHGTVVGCGGNGVQVCLPSEFVILDGSPALNSGMVSRENGANSTFYPVVGSETLVAARTDAAEKYQRAPGFREDMLPIICFAPDGAMHVHSASSRELLSVAQALHDSLVEQTPFTRRPERHEKFKGSHSDVFQSALSQ